MVKLKLSFKSLKGLHKMQYKKKNIQQKSIARKLQQSKLKLKIIRNLSDEFEPNTQTQNSELYRYIKSAIVLTYNP